MYSQNWTRCRCRPSESTPTEWCFWRRKWTVRSRIDYPWWFCDRHKCNCRSRLSRKPLFRYYYHSFQLTRRILDGQYEYEGTCYNIDFCGNPALTQCSEDCSLVDHHPFYECHPFADACLSNPCSAIFEAQCYSQGAGFECICPDDQPPVNNSCRRDPCADDPCESCETCYQVQGTVLATVFLQSHLQNLT